MNAILRHMLALSAAIFAGQAAAQITFYEHTNFQGRAFTTHEQIGSLERSGFNNLASSAVVRGEAWQVCDGAAFSGRCAILREGEYKSFREVGLNDAISSMRVVGRDARAEDQRYSPPPPPAAAYSAHPGTAQITFYEGEGFAGRSFTTDRQVRNFDRFGFNDRASSVEVLGSLWEVCDGAGFSGRCVILRPGRYPSLSAMGLNDGVSSVRAASRDARIEDSPHRSAGDYDYRRRSNEQLYLANVTSVRAVVGTPEQRCWVEQEQIPQDRRTANVPAAIAGAVIGGILGHQIGSGTGRDIATVGGAVAGGALGSQVAGGAQQARTQDVRRCENVPSAARPDYWDVTYSFRGQEYRMQMTVPPGSTVTVNERGEPRA